MTIRFTCSECGSVLKIKDELAGTSAKCPKCKTKFVIPSLSSDDDPPAGESAVVQDRPSESAAPSSAEVSTQPADSVPAGLIINEPTAEVQSNSVRASDEESEPSDMESGHEIAPARKHGAKLTAEFSESPTVATGTRGTVAEDDAPLSLGDSDDDIDAMHAVHKANGAENAAAAMASDDVDGDDEDDDSPSLFVSSVMTPKAPTEPEEKTSERKKPSSEKSAKPSKADSSKQEDAFDPLKYLMADPPTKPRNMFPEPSQDDSDLSLSDDEIDTFGEPTPQPPSRPTPAAMNVRATPEKVDLATAARMMKKAIKDSQAEAAHQREMEANAGFDYFLFFREFGVRGFAVLGGGIALFILCLFIGNYVFSSKIKLPPLGYVNGTVTLDGQPLAGATVMFEPMDVKMEGEKRDRVRTSTAITDEKGYYRMMYRPDERIEGVAVGKCRVWVTHVGAKGEDVPAEWGFHAFVVKEVTAGRQKEPIDISMMTKIDPKKKK